VPNCSLLEDEQSALAIITQAEGQAGLRGIQHAADLIVSSRLAILLSSSKVLLNFFLSQGAAFVDVLQRLER